MRAYSKPPEPYVRPGVQRRKRLNAAGRAYLAKLIENRGATERPMTAGQPGAG